VGGFFNGRGMIASTTFWWKPEGFAADWHRQIFCPADRKYAQKATAVAGSNRILREQ